MDVNCGQCVGKENWSDRNTSYDYCDECWEYSGSDENKQRRTRCKRLETENDACRFDF